MTQETTLWSFNVCFRDVTVLESGIQLARMDDNGAVDRAAGLQAQP